MRFVRWVLPLLLLSALYSSEDSHRVDGKWVVEFVSGLQMKTIGGADFIFKVAGNELTGSANIGYGWPGKAPISDGRIDGERISFTVQGRHWSSTGYPKMRFSGIAHGNEIKLTMNFYPDTASPNPIGQVEFRGTRASH